MNSEITADCLNKIGQLALVTARIAHKIGHHTARFLPSKVRILKFSAADMCAKNREKHRNQRFMHVF